MTKKKGTVQGLTEEVRHAEKYDVSGQWGREDFSSF